MAEKNNSTKKNTANDRQEEIVVLLMTQGDMTYAELSEKLDVSEMTIRRDALELEEKYRVQKTDIGKIGLVREYVVDPGFSQRKTSNLKSKTAISSEAIKFIKEGMSIAIDSSTTCLELTKKLVEFDNLTVVTNSIVVPNLLIKSNSKVISSGGVMRKKSFSLVGKAANDRLSNYFYDYCFFSVDAIDIKRGITDTNEEEIHTKHAMLKNATTKVLLADSSKFDSCSYCYCCEISDIDILITDKELNKRYKEKFEELGVKVIVARV